MQQLSNSKKVPALDARLAAAAAYVRQGCTAADIGCDHGKLAVALAVKGQCRKIIAGDIRPAPLASAQRLVAEHHCDNAVECRLGAGLSVLRPGEADDVVIAGVSGITICEILQDAPQGFYESGKELHFIFVPATKHPALRRFLAQNGFHLLDETPVRAAGRCYTVMNAVYTGMPEVHDDLWEVCGCISHGAAAAEYLLHEASLLKKEARGAENAEKERLQALAQKVEEEAQKCCS